MQFATAADEEALVRDVLNDGMFENELDLGKELLFVDEFRLLQYGDVVVHQRLRLGDPLQEPVRVAQDLVIPEPEHPESVLCQPAVPGRVRGAFEMLADSYPNEAWAFEGLGRAFVRLGRLDEAQRAYERLLEISPQDTDAADKLKAIREQATGNGQRATGRP